MVVFRGDQRHGYRNPGATTTVAYSVIAFAPEAGAGPSLEKEGRAWRILNTGTGNGAEPRRCRCSRICPGWKPTG